MMKWQPRDFSNNIFRSKNAVLIKIGQQDIPAKAKLVD